jgi:nicotinamide mononucleotide transporter
MEFWDWIALVTGILGVLLTIFETIWCWPMALISVIISTVTFYNQRLYGDMSLNVFYFFSGIYGWIYWNQNKHKAFVVTHMNVKWILPITLSIIIQSIAYYYILSYFKSDQVIFDAILTACSFTCTFMMTKKWVENWLLWVIIDGAYVVLYLIKDMPTYALLYAFFTLMAAYGFYKWRKQLIVT